MVVYSIKCYLCLQLIDKLFLRLDDRQYQRLFKCRPQFILLVGRTVSTNSSIEGPDIWKNSIQCFCFQNCTKLWRIKLLS